MSKYSHLIYSFFIAALVVSVIISFHNNNVLEKRIDAIYENVPLTSSESTFKMDYYLRQSERDTTLLLIVFPIIVGILSFFTYRNITERFRSEIDNIHNEAKEKEAEWNKIKVHISKFKSEYEFDKHLTFKVKSVNYLFDENYKLYVDNFLYSLDSLYEYLNHFLSADNKDFSDFIKNEIKKELIDFEKQLSKVGGEIELNNESYLNEILNKIRLLKLKDVESVLYSIRSKFIFS